MENGGRMAHGNPRPARTPSRQQQIIVFFRILYEAVIPLIYVTGLCSAGRVGYPSWEVSDPRQLSGTWYHSCAVRCQIVREDVAIVDTCMVVFGPIGLCSLHVRQPVVTLTAPQTAGRRVPFCIHDYRAFRTAQAALQTAANRCSQ